jgi:hypothetical protein
VVETNDSRDLTMLNCARIFTDPRFLNTLAIVTERTSTAQVEDSRERCLRVA